MLRKSSKASLFPYQRGLHHQSHSHKSMGAHLDLNLARM